MITLQVGKKGEGKRIDRYISSELTELPFSLLQKTFRKRDVKVNGVRVKPDYILQAGDRIDLYAQMEAKEQAKEQASSFNDSTNPEIYFSSFFSVVYEDENILIVNKKQGIPVHSDKTQDKVTLIDVVRDYLKNTGGFNSDNTFQPSLCHRLDRNTGGLVIIAKTERSYKELLEKFESGEIKKYYQCLVKGRPIRDAATLKAWLFKDEGKSRVYIGTEKSKGSVEIITRYKLLAYNGELDISKLEVELLTGRTHQIRAHLAFIGHPVIGDGKYGSNALNKPLGVNRQELWAYKLIFNFSKAGCLDYLKGKTFESVPLFRLNHI